MALTILVLAPMLATGRAEAPFAWLTRSDRTGSASPVGPGGSPSGTSSTAPLGPLFDALGDRRPVEPRLTGSSAHAPCQAPPADPDDLIPLPRCSPLPEPGTEAFRSLTRASTTLLAGDRTGASPDLLHARGLWHLLWPEQDGAPDRAVEALETAALRTPDDGPKRARILSDLAAAYLIRAAVQDRPLDLIQAMDAADRALEADPDLPEARFNHALALEKLWLRTPAKTAWETYLDADSASSWAAEALRRHKILNEPTVLEAWEIDRPLLSRAAADGDTDTVRTLVLRYAAPARDWIEEELLPAWGEAVLAGDPPEAERTLRVARSVARVLAAEIGEHMPADAVRAIDESNPATRTSLAEGHVLFGRGMGHYNRQDCTAASAAFRGSGRSFLDVRSPFVVRTILQQEICAYYEDPAATITALQGLRSEYPLDRHPTLDGRIRWMLGLSEWSRGQPTAAETQFAAGLEPLLEIQDPGAGALLSDLGSTADAAGDAQAAWNRRLAGLSILAQHGEPKRLYNALHAVVTTLVQEGLPQLAVHFEGELLAVAETWGEPAPLADAHLTRARTYLDLGRSEDAVADFGAARSLTDEVPRGDLRRRFEADLLAGMGEARRRSEPETAEEMLSLALESYRATGHLLEVPRILVARAENRATLGRVEEAETDLLEAIDEIERGTEASEAGLQHFEDTRYVRRIYGAMARFQIDHRNHPGAALRWFDRLHSRGLRTTRESPRGAHRVASPPLVGRLPDGVTAVEYGVFEDRLALWILRDELITIMHPLPASELARRVDSLRAAIETRDTETAIRDLAGPLFDTLVRPAVRVSKPGDTLLLVLDGALHRLPFAALWNSQESEYLTESHPLVRATSLHRVLLRQDRPPRSSPDPRALSILAVGTSAFDRSRHPELPLLPHAEAEVQMVSAPYASAELMIGPQATRRGVLAALARHPDVVHLASHAVLGRTRTELLLAPSEDATDRSSLTGDDLARLDLSRTDLLFLSGCRTASVLFARGSEGGVPRLLRQVEGPAVVANLWSVADEPTGELARAFHLHYAEERDAARALQHTQAALIRGAIDSRAHPVHWAGWIVHDNEGAPDE